MSQVVANKRLVSIAAAAVGVAWAALLLAGPWVAEWSAAAGGILYLAGGLVCHQQADRSFHLAGVQLPVCARCLGLYAGGALGLVAWASTTRARLAAWPRTTVVRWLAVAAAPTGLTVLSAWTGLGDPSNAWRATLAVPLGLAAGLVLGAATTEHLK